MPSYLMIDPNSQPLNFPRQAAEVVPYIEDYTPQALPALELSPLMQGNTPSPFASGTPAVSYEYNPASTELYAASTPRTASYIYRDPTIPYPSDDELYASSRKYYNEQIARKYLDPLQRRVFTKSGTPLAQQASMFVDSVRSNPEQFAPAFRDALQLAGRMEKELNDIQPNPSKSKISQREASYRQSVGRNLKSAGLGAFNVLGLLSAVMNPDPLDPLGQLVIGLNPESYPEQVQQLDAMLERQRNMVY